MYPEPLNVPYIDQTDRWPTGCESVSMVMLLQYLGFRVEVDDFIRGYLPMAPMEQVNGCLYGPDPRKTFCGSPWDDRSFGCYPPVAVTALNRFLAEKGPSHPHPPAARDLTGIPTEELLRDYVYRGFPVLYWTGIDLKETIPGPRWTIRREDGREEDFLWISNEHCMLLVGGDEKHLIFNDPWHNHGVIAYDRALAEKRHCELGNMAAAVVPEDYEHDTRGGSPHEFYHL